MKIANMYSHLNGYEFMLVHRQDLWAEIENAIKGIDANDYVKFSRDKVRTGKPLYDQKRINKEFEHILFPQGWKSVTTPYYVTGDIPTEREIVGIRDRTEQKKMIEAKGFEAYSTNNQVDFVKDRVAVEVQFGKYFSVAYDLHVKHFSIYAMTLMLVLRSFQQKQCAQKWIPASLGSRMKLLMSFVRDAPIRQSQS